MRRHKALPSGRRGLRDLSAAQQVRYAVGLLAQLDLGQLGDLSATTQLSHLTAQLLELPVTCGTGDVVTTVRLSP